MQKIDWTNLIVKGTKWFASLAILNICWLLYSLPLFTVIPSTDTVFQLLKDWETEHKEAGIWNQFHQTFKDNFKRSFKIGIPIFLVFAIIGIDIYFLNTVDISSGLFQILKYAFYTFSFILSLGILYAITFMKRLEQTNVRIVIFGFVMAVLHPIITLMAVGSILVLMVVCLVWPSMIFFFFVSGMAWIMTKAASKVMELEQEKSLNKQN